MDKIESINFGALEIEAGYLTPFQAAVALLIASGLTDKEIAKDTGHSIPGVIQAKRRVFDKLEINRRGAVAAECMRRGIMHANRRVFSMSKSNKSVITLFNEFFGVAPSIKTTSTAAAFNRDMKQRPPVVQSDSPLAGNRVVHIHRHK